MSILAKTDVGRWPTLARGGATVGLYAKLKKGKTKKQLPAPETARDWGGRASRGGIGVFLSSTRCDTFHTEHPAVFITRVFACCFVRVQEIDG